VIDDLFAYSVTGADSEATARRPRLAETWEPIDLTSGATVRK
jgi:hypothetical protein